MKTMDAHLVARKSFQGRARASTEDVLDNGIKVEHLHD
jgi:hypothetical protein